MASTSTSALGMALTILEALPGLLEAGSAAEQLVVGGIAAIRGMEQQGRNPTQAEWDAINGQIAVLSGELSAPEDYNDPNDPNVGVLDENGQPIKASAVFVDAPAGTGADGLVRNPDGSVVTAAVPKDANGEPVAETLTVGAPPGPVPDSPIVAPGAAATQLVDPDTGAPATQMVSATGEPVASVTAENASRPNDLNATTSTTTTGVAGAASLLKEPALGASAAAGAHNTESGNEIVGLTGEPVTGAANMLVPGDDNQAQLNHASANANAPDYVNQSAQANNGEPTDEEKRAQEELNG